MLILFLLLTWEERVRSCFMYLQHAAEMVPAFSFLLQLLPLFTLNISTDTGS